jgi:putative transcriptional regulator
MFDTYSSDTVILQTLGQRLLADRLQRNWTQAALAEEAGVSKRTIERLESGESVQLANLIRILRSLQKLSLLEHVFPEPLASPMQQLKMQGKQRQRAHSKKNLLTNPKTKTSEVNETPSNTEWQWSDE